MDDNRRVDAFVANNLGELVMPALNRSFLYSIRVENFGCVGPEGVEVQLDEIVCFVGTNNSGKSTILRAYEAAVTNANLSERELCTRRDGKAAVIELFVHIPEGTANIDEKWKEHRGELRLVRSRWTWEHQGKPVRQTYDPSENDWAENGKAAGVDTVFASRLPQPFRIGALDGPHEEQAKLMKLILEPIAEKLDALLAAEETEVSKKREEFLKAARAPVIEFQKDVEKAQKQVAKSFGKIFGTAELGIDIDVAPPNINALESLMKGSAVWIKEHGSKCELGQQGTGSQRALFWSMLEVRSALKRDLDVKKSIAAAKETLEKEIKKLEAKALVKAEAIAKRDEQIVALKERLNVLEKPNDDAVILPGYMLLIDEPEIALHPNAVRAAKDHLYSLASDSGWQVMLSTHSPVFVDPTQDHTTIVRLERNQANPTPRLYRSDEAELTSDDREQLRMLLRFDPSVAEMFFGSYPILVEGDTEFAAFLQVINSDPALFPQVSRPAVIRSVGKAVLVPLVKILRHFKVPFTILHDADSPKRRDGKKSGTWSENWKIYEAVKACRETGVRVVHRVSIPDFERRMSLIESDKDKPFRMWQAMKDDPAVLAQCTALLQELLSAESDESEYADEFEQGLTDAVVKWAEKNAVDDGRFVVN